MESLFSAADFVAGTSLPPSSICKTGLNVKNVADNGRRGRYTAAALQEKEIVHREPVGTDTQPVF
jgi:hypothetical protein